MTETGTGSYASPPCFMHELDPAFSGVTDEQTAIDLARWRRAERARLIAERQAYPVANRAEAEARIGAELSRRIGPVAGRVIGLYWPFKGEPDLRAWAEAQRQAGASLALPVVVAKGAPLIFRRWNASTTLERGVWNIPIPSAEAPECLPDVVISPIVGLDNENYRLGYGGGFYDRTLARMRAGGAVVRVIGVGFEFQRIRTIFPQAYDVAMDEAVLAG